jgi:hypothetical protein
MYIHHIFSHFHSKSPDILDLIFNIPSPTVKYLRLSLDRRLTWAHHIQAKRLQLNSHLRMLKTLIVNNKHSKLNIKLLLYKSLLLPMWTYGLQLGCNAKISYNKIQISHNSLQRKLPIPLHTYLITHYIKTYT